jgi:hypothetical protein
MKKKNTVPPPDASVLKYYDRDKLCTTIYIDFENKLVWATNHTDDIVTTAFGNNASPDWDDFIYFLKDRCIPEERAGLREYLAAIGVYEFDPLEIIKKTKGRMAEDAQWIDTEGLKWTSAL